MSGHDMIDEGELSQLFARRRPDPERFAAGIAQRLAGGDSNRDADPDQRNGALPQAASWLPIGLTGNLNLAGKMGGGKFWFFLSLPLLLLIGSWLAMIGSARLIRDSLRGVQIRKPHNSDTQHSSTPRTPARLRPLAKQLPGCLASTLVLGSMVVVPMLGWPHLIDSLLVASVVSMFALAMLVRLSARAGQADRRQVAILCIGLLDVLLIITLLHGIHGMRETATGQWAVASAGVVAGGVLMLMRFAPSHAYQTLGFAGCFILLAHFWPSQMQQPQPPTIAQVHAFATAPELKANSRRLPKLRSIVLALRAAGYEINLPEDIGLELAKPPVPRSPISSFALAECARADLLTPEAWTRIAKTRFFARKLNRFLAATGPIDLPYYEEFLFRLLITRSLTEQQHTQLVARLTSSWPDDKHRTPMAQSRIIANALDLLGHRDLADANRERIHTLLVRQQETAGWRPGGFAELPRSNIDTRLPANAGAMELIARFGLPSELNLHALHRHLEKQSLLPNPKYATREGANDDAFEAFAHLQQLNAQMGPLPSRALLALLIDERMFWSMLALVLLCLYAVKVAPVSIASRAGAMP